jgi:hypothetical protein
MTTVINIHSLFLAICMVESNNDQTAYNPKEGATGIAQIRMCVIQDVNRKYNRKYKLSDAYNIAKAREIFELYISMYCTRERLKHEPTHKDAARIWNGGPMGHKKKNTLDYWNRVEKQLRKGW